MAFNNYVIVNKLFFKFRKGVFLYFFKLLYFLITEGISNEIKEVVVRILIRYNNVNSLF